MTLYIGDTAPDFTAATSTAKINLHDWIGGDWVFTSATPAISRPTAQPSWAGPRNSWMLSPNATSSRSVCPQSAWRSI